MTNEQAVREALDAVANDINKWTTDLIIALRRDVELSRGRMPNDAFEIYEIIKRARIEGIEYAEQLAGRAIMQQKVLTAESKQ